MKNSDFDIGSTFFGLFIGTILGILLTALSMNYGVEKERQTECKVLDGIQICRNVDFFPWKVKEADK